MIRNKGQGRSKGAIVDIMSFALVDVNVKSVSELVEFVQGQVKESLCFWGVAYKKCNGTNETDSGSTLFCQLWPTTEKNTGAIWASPGWNLVCWLRSLRATAHLATRDTQQSEHCSS